MSQASYIFDADSSNFDELVVANSHKGPVLVNYWSPGAAPCFKLWPLLEKLAAEYNGRFLLVNINTEKQRALARENGINSLPTVKFYRSGQVVEQVHGAESESVYRSLIDRHIIRPSDAAVSAALKVYQAGDSDKSFRMLADIAVEDPESLRVPLTLARLLFKEGRYADVVALLASLPEGFSQEQEVISLYTHAEFSVTAENASAPESLEKAISNDAENLHARYQLAAINLLEDNYEEALQQLIEIMQRDPDFMEAVGRRGMTAIFAILGSAHPLVREYRNHMLNILH